MKLNSNAWKEGAEMRQNVRNIAIGFSVLAGLALWVTLTGHTARAVYVGIEPGTYSPDVAYLRTDPDASYIMPRNGDFQALKAGCRYDFTYEPTFGRVLQKTRAIRPRHVRSATLVDCPGVRS